MKNNFSGLEKFTTHPDVTFDERNAINSLVGHDTFSRLLNTIVLKYSLGKDGSRLSAEAFKEIKDIVDLYLRFSEVEQVSRLMRSDIEKCDVELVNPGLIFGSLIPFKEECTEFRSEVCFNPNDFCTVYDEKGHPNGLNGIADAGFVRSQILSEHLSRDCVYQLTDDCYPANRPCSKGDFLGCIVDFEEEVEYSSNENEDVPVEEPALTTDDEDLSRFDLHSETPLDDDGGQETAGPDEVTGVYNIGEIAKDFKASEVNDTEDISESEEVSPENREEGFIYTEEEVREWYENNFKRSQSEGNERLIMALVLLRKFLARQGHNDEDIRPELIDESLVYGDRLNRVLLSELMKQELSDDRLCDAIFELLDFDTPKYNTEETFVNENEVSRFLIKYSEEEVSRLKMGKLKRFCLDQLHPDKYVDNIEKQEEAEEISKLLMNLHDLFVEYNSFDEDRSQEDFSEYKKMLSGLISSDNQVALEGFKNVLMVTTDLLSQKIKGLRSKPIEMTLDLSEGEEETFEFINGRSYDLTLYGSNSIFNFPSGINMKLMPYGSGHVVFSSSVINLAITNVMKGFEGSIVAPSFEGLNLSLRPRGGLKVSVPDGGFINNSTIELFPNDGGDSHGELFVNVEFLDNVEVFSSSHLRLEFTNAENFNIKHNLLGDVDATFMISGSDIINFTTDISGDEDQYDGDKRFIEIINIYKSKFELPSGTRLEIRGEIDDESVVSPYSGFITVLYKNQEFRVGEGCSISEFSLESFGSYDPENETYEPKSDAVPMFEKITSLFKK